MSFILDALQRAESLRGGQAKAPVMESSLGQIAGPTDSRRPLGLGLLLLSAVIVTIAALILLMQPDNTATDLAAVNRQSQNNPAVDIVIPDTPLAEVANSSPREVRSLNREVARATPARSPATGTVTVSSEALSAEQPVRANRPGTVTVSQTPLSATSSRAIGNVSGEILPSYEELVLNRRVQMPEFHLDIHVYAPAPERRFVFVNNRKYREGEKLDEGGSVERITPVGAVLNHKGHRFELVPD